MEFINRNLIVKVVKDEFVRDGLNIKVLPTIRVFLRVYTCRFVSQTF